MRNSLDLRRRCVQLVDRWREPQKRKSVSWASGLEQGNNSRSSEMIRSVIVVGSWLTAVGFVVLAQEPKPAESKKPQWQRLLTGDDAKTAEKLQQQINKSQAADDYAAAIKAAEELLVLRTKVQGGDHYETVNLKHDI